MSFTVEPSPLAGLVYLKPRIHADERGFLLEVMRQSEFARVGIPGPWVQANHSLSYRGVLRGIHFQKEPHAQGKLIRVVAGTIWDVAVDLRPDSRTHLGWHARELSAEDRTMAYLPPGFGHGFLTMTDQAQVVYLTTAEYSPEDEGGLRWDDPALAIAWPDVGAPYQVSAKDAGHPAYSRRKS